MSRLLAEDILNKSFPRARRGGYDEREVDEFLTQVANDYRTVLERAKAAAVRADPYQQLGDQVASVLRTAKENADKIRRQAEEEVRTIRTRAADKALELRRQAQQEADTTVLKAQERAEKLTQDAQAHARQVRESAERERAKILDDALERHERLKAHEQDVRSRIAGIEEALKLLRVEIDSGAAETPEGEGEANLPVRELSGTPEDHRPEAEVSREVSSGVRKTEGAPARLIR